MKKLTIVISTIVVLLLGAISVSAMTGEGTEISPYLIETEEDFLTVGFLPDKHYKLMNEISVTDSIPEFSGNFDGNGYGISTENDYIFTVNKGTIKNLVVDSVNLVNANEENAFITDCTISNGILTTTNDGVIKSCSSTFQDGKMVVTNNGTVKNCTAVKGNLVTTNNGIIENSSLNSDEYEVYITYDNYGVINNCSVTDNSGQSASAISHINYTTAVINKCTVVNGLIADTNYGKINCCSSSGEGHYAGIVISNYGEIVGCLSDKEIISYYPISNTYDGHCNRGAGGIAVNNYEDAKIINCYYKGIISLSPTMLFSNQNTYVGGISGINRGNIEACYTDGDIDVSETASSHGNLDLYVGGITGYGGTVLNCYSMQDIDAFGRCDSTEDSNCYASGIGNANTIEDCYFSGTLKMTSYTCNVYSAGIGYADNITNSYYESDSPFSDDAEHGTPLSATMLKLQESFIGWDFDEVWSIDSEINNGYPYLVWQNVEQEDITEPINVTSVTVDKSELSLNVGESDVITATVLPDNATNKNVSWASSDTSVATVVSGAVTAVGAGNATITVTTEDGNYKALCSVVVTETSEPTEPNEPTEPDAEDTPTLRIESVTGKAGESVTVALNIENNPGILGMMLKLTYDENLVLSSVVQSTGEEDSALETLDFTVSGDLTLIPLNMAWEGLDADSTNGKILNMTFIIPEDAEDGAVYDISASYTKGEVYDNEMNDIDLEIVDGSVIVKSYTIGDINDDGIINIKDITLLRRGVVGGYGITLNEAADVNCDGITNIKDITIIRRYVIGGYGVTLGK